MDVSGLLTHLIQAELELPDAARQRFRVGDTLQLSVLEVISANRVRVDLGKFQAVADIQFPVAPGDELKVTVEAAGKQLKLRVANPNEAPASQPAPAVKPNTYFLTRFAEPLRQDINRFLTQAESGRSLADALPERVFNAMKAVAAHLEPLQPQGDIELLANRVKEKVEASGLFFEKKLEQVVSDISKDREKLPTEILQRAGQLVRGDLKAQLIVLKRFFDNPSNITDRTVAESAGQLNRAVTGMLSEISEQLTNTRQADPNQLFHIVMYDLPIRDGGRNGLLKMYFSRKGSRRDRNSFRLSLLLSMDRLGEIRSDIVMQEKDLTLMFFVTGENARAHFQPQLENIRQSLLAFFPRVSVSVTLADKKLAEFETDLLQVDSDRKIDMRV